MNVRITVKTAHRVHVRVKTGVFIASVNSNVVSHVSPVWRCAPGNAGTTHVQNDAVSHVIGRHVTEHARESLNVDIDV